MPQSGDKAVAAASADAGFVEMFAGGDDENPRQRAALCAARSFAWLSCTVGHVFQQLANVNTPPVPPPATAPRPKGMAGMKAMDRTTSNALLDELVQKMNAAQGEAKVDAIAELLTALVRTHQRMHAETGSMMSKRHPNPEGVAAK